MSWPQKKVPAEPESFSFRYVAKRLEPVLACILTPLLFLLCSCECEPDCNRKNCGDDGCGGSCGVCTGCEGEILPEHECHNGHCPMYCCPNCTGKCCGDDGCGATCPDRCPAGYICNQRHCVCDKTCQADEDCKFAQCCIDNVCTNDDCGNIFCGPDPVCGMECGTCLSGDVCDQGQCSMTPYCRPACPEGSECLDTDNILLPECVWPSGELACVLDMQCPADGYCWIGNKCHYLCVCTADDDCGPEEICLTPQKNCGICVSKQPFACEVNYDCVVAAFVDCCTLLIPYNASAVQNEPCVLEYPFTESPPRDCSIDCFDHHCWPPPKQLPIPVCLDGACRLEPPPIP